MVGNPDPPPTTRIPVADDSTYGLSPGTKGNLPSPKVTPPFGGQSASTGCARGRPAPRPPRLRFAQLLGPSLLQSCVVASSAWFASFDLLHPPRSPTSVPNRAFPATFPARKSPTEGLPLGECDGRPKPSSHSRSRPLLAAHCQSLCSKWLKHLDLHRPSWRLRK